MDFCCPHANFLRHSLKVRRGIRSTRGDASKGLRRRSHRRRVLRNCSYALWGISENRKIERTFAPKKGLTCTQPGVSTPGRWRQIAPGPERGARAIGPKTSKKSVTASVSASTSTNKCRRTLGTAGKLEMNSLNRVQDRNQDSYFNS